jgi:hypothetical protein
VGSPPAYRHLGSHVLLARFSLHKTTLLTAPPIQLPFGTSGPLAPADPALYLQEGLIRLRERGPEESFFWRGFAALQEGREEEALFYLVLGKVRGNNDAERQWSTAVLGQLLQ